MKTHIIVISLFLSLGGEIMAKNVPIPFKHGWRMKDAHVREFERGCSVAVPHDIIRAYGQWNGGSVDGWLVFDLPECRKLAVTKFLAFGKPSEGGDPDGDFVITEVATNPHLSYQAINRLDIIPLAVVNGSVCEKEQKNALNCRSVLVFKRGSGSTIFLLSGVDGRITKIASSLSELLNRCIFWFQFLEPGP